MANNWLDLVLNVNQIWIHEINFGSIYSSLLFVSFSFMLTLQMITRLIGLYDWILNFNTIKPKNMFFLQKVVNKEKMSDYPKEDNARTSSVNCNLGVIKLNNSGDDVSNLINTHSSLSKSYSKMNGCDVDLLNAINKSKRMEDAKSPLPLRETNNLTSCLTKG